MWGFPAPVVASPGEGHGYIFARLSRRNIEPSRRPIKLGGSTFARL
jgi:hypothetical protein